MQGAHEVFADRTKQDDGTLTPRTDQHAMIKNHEIAVEQVQTVSGKIIPIKADTVCLHGDSEHAITFTKLTHKACQHENIVIEKLTVF
ncbi:LamB/YcsF family protein [Bacillus chungangensis]|uniref:Lactam utilization protein B n=1 Tax=Bacillus chungangensis TaxID=587633 RepID=A0ABT9WVN0_9BACI|nr:LamB/YcsF family protein [Bacillus chungangensis]MDQ0177169.1 lactam utilization protein B [Bacillus chungangensis]